jgi:hypothetical protein
VVWLASAVTAGCAQDKVHPGFYGPPGSDGSSVPHEGPSAAGAGAFSPPPPSMGASAGAGAGSQPSVDSGAGGAGASASAGADALAGVGGSAASGPLGQNPSPAPADACDLSGRWLSTLHFVTDAIGQQQTAHSYVYYEIARQDGAYAITKGLHCGDDAVAEGAFAVTVDFSRAWDGIREHLSYVGRSVTSTGSADGCDVRFGRWYTVQGATYPHYADPSIPLPTANQPASGTTPGWEDWDADGQPGITGYISGIVAGKIYLAPRMWSELSGRVPSAGDRMRLRLAWDQTKNVIGYEGSELLASDAVRAADPSLHFAELVRLDAAQAQGEDAAICNAVVELAKTLTQAAAGI